jgi:hypothetical protein
MCSDLIVLDYHAEASSRGATPGHPGPLPVKPRHPAAADHKETTMVKKPSKPTPPRVVRGKATKARKAAPTPQPKTTKQDQVLALLRRQNGASLDEIVAATDWKPHSARGFLAGAVKKRLKIEVVSEKNAETGERRYHVAAIKS